MEGFIPRTESEVNVQQKLIDEAKKYVGEFPLAKPALTAAQVSSALLSWDGRIYSGVCIDAACGVGFCAEHAAIAEMLKHRETRIQMIVAVSAKGIRPPCGRCRELMWQVNPLNKDAKIILKDGVTTLEDLLPQPWL